ncbi:hypothetical protein HDU76_007585 [Blyttiomyces sp. JEL0837]|nr:hypothetical protein HDU76_007585 [Blyttiomyces sp. JEL0837]
MNNPIFTFPDYLLREILNILKLDMKSLQQMRSVSKTWRDFTDRVYFRKVKITDQTIDSFIDWKSTPTSKPASNATENCNKETDTNSLIPTTSSSTSATAKSLKLKVLVIDFPIHDLTDFDFGLLKNLVHVEVMAVNGSKIQLSSFSLIDLFGSLPISLKILKLRVSPRSLVSRDVDADSETTNLNQLQHLRTLQILFRSGTNDVIPSFNNDQTEHLQQLFSWVFPNLETFKLQMTRNEFVDGVAVFQNPNATCSTFLNVIIGTLELVAIGLEHSLLLHFNNFQQLCIVHYSLGTSKHEFMHIIQDENVLPKLSLSSICFDGTPLGSNDAMFRAKLLNQVGNLLTHLYFGNGVSVVIWWNDMVKVWEDVEGFGNSGGNGGGNRCHNLECVTFLKEKSSYWLEPVDKLDVIMFVYSLPKSVKRIVVCNKIWFKDSDAFLRCLGEYATRRGIVVSVEDVESPGAIYCYPSSVGNV